MSNIPKMPSKTVRKTIKKPATKERTGINPFTKEEQWFAAKPASVKLKVRPLKKLKDAAFKHAVDILGNASLDDEKEDDVAALFTKELRAYASDLEAKQGQVIKLTEAEQSELQADLDAYMNRFGLEDASFKAPKEVKIELM